MSAARVVGGRGARTRRAVAALVTTLLALGALLGDASPAHAAAQVDGAGSTWSAIAVSEWAADVRRQGLSINYQANGSTAGRVFYYNNQVDFAVSEIPFQPDYRDATGSVSTNEIQLAAHRPYAYMPIVAGGTSFMYHLDINGKRFRDLRLAPETVAKIFTGVIRAWNDPAIVADNPGVPLPGIPIKPVIRSDGSGTSAQFTAFMASQTPAVYQDFCRRVGIANACRATSLYPEFPGSIGQQLSDGVAAFVAAPYNNGAITYVEYGYAKQRDYPVASVLNRAGYYIQPTAPAVAIALQGAKLNPDGTQQLVDVYNFPDARAYPVSSYSYMIVPTTTAAPFTAEKGKVLSDFILYFACAGQQKAANLGYSPLPRVLVEVVFAAVRRIPGASAPPPIEQCNNPTITGDFIPNAAPPPPVTQRQGAAAAGGDAGGGGSTEVAAIDPESAALDGSADLAASTDGELLSASGPVTLRGGGASSSTGVWFLAIALLAAIVFAPPTLARFLERRRESTSE